MAGRLEQKVALVTGGGSGIGRASAVAFAREGAKIAVSDIHITGGEETVRLIQAAGGTALFVQADVSRAADVEALVKKVVEVYGRLDCALNNAGIQGEIRQTAECSEENWNHIIAINLTGVWLCMKHELAYMMPQGRSTIVNTASNFGLAGSQRMPAYSARVVLSRNSAL
jgi:NAD(P)-dependent dehydrogenase (short-subunit alcohol dehydrogenase family)